MERRQALAIIAKVRSVRYTQVSHLDFAHFPLYSADSWHEAGLSRSAALAVVKAFQEQDHDPLLQARARAIVIGDPDYPPTLNHLYSPPLVLYVRGQLEAERGVAVVGTRKATPYGRQAVEMVVPVLVAALHTVVSGLARGIDTLAHGVALRCGGKTIAVMGRGLDAIYPRENSLLAEKIVEQGGALVSEYREGTPPLAGHFPARNRIISGLSRICLVIEGDMGSGALITAEHALEQGKEVLAVPGSIFSPQSRGTNYLIAQGATPLLDPNVIYETLGTPAKPLEAPTTLELRPEESLVLMALSTEPLSVDEVCMHTGLPVAVAAAALTALEVAEAIERLPGGAYLRLRG
ncbi:MAG: DNA processing protein DprA [Firmicutes bacterium]|nr:DNA processing protein DprA [candidate division NPL-UPA2 bacterium]